MIKYKAYCGDGNIEKVDVVKETKNFMVLVADKEWFPDGRKEAKESDYHKYFDDYNDAKKWVIGELNWRIEKLEKEMEMVELYKVKAQERELADFSK